MAWYDQMKRTNLEIDVIETIPLSTLLQRLSIPRAEVAIISINGNMFNDDDILVRNTDIILLYPPVGGG